jgi:hypothetical protein
MNDRRKGATFGKMMLGLVGFAVPVLIWACSSSTETISPSQPADASVDGTSGPGRGEPCPVELPKPDAPCKRDRSICEYGGTGPGRVCSQRAQCSNGRWTIAAPQAEVCSSQGQIVNPAACPAAFNQAPKGECLPLKCIYPEGACVCANCREPSSTALPPAPPPPAPPPPAPPSPPVDASLSDGSADDASDDAAEMTDGGLGDGSLEASSDSGSVPPKQRTQWACSGFAEITATPGCPVERPLLGSACQQDELICTYGPLDGCQIGTNLVCSRGEWSPRANGSVCFVDVCK